jgi:hypothetical protein
METLRFLEGFRLLNGPIGFRLHMSALTHTACMIPGYSPTIRRTTSYLIMYSYSPVLHM